MRIVIALSLVASACFGQVAEDANRHYQTEAGRAALARGLGSRDRDERQHPHELVELLGIKPGMTVADVGTGVGYMLPYLSAAVGPSGRVIAEDIFPDFLRDARQRAADRKLSNVQFVQGTSRELPLPEDAVDLALVLDVYHHFDYPSLMLGAIRQALKPGGRLAVVEYNKSTAGLPANHIRLDESGAVREIESHGFRAVERREFPANNQWIAVFTRK